MPASLVATASGVWMTKFSRASSGIADPGVEDAVEDVGQEVEEDHEGGGDEQVGQHDVDVERGDAGDVPGPETLPPEDVLGEDGATEDRREVQGDDGGDRDQCVAQDMARQDAAPAQALGTG